MGRSKGENCILLPLPSVQLSQQKRQFPSLPLATSQPKWLLVYVDPAVLGIVLSGSEKDCWGGKNMGKIPDYQCLQLRYLLPTAQGTRPEKWQAELCPQNVFFLPPLSSAGLFLPKWKNCSWRPGVCWINMGCSVSGDRGFSSAGKCIKNVTFPPLCVWSIFHECKDSFGSSPQLAIHWDVYFSSPVLLGKGY